MAGGFMRFKIEHEIKGRMRVHLIQKRMSFQEADILQYQLESYPFITSAKIYTRNQNVVMCYQGERQQVIRILQEFSYEKADVPAEVLENSGREMNQKYWDKLVFKVIIRATRKYWIPYPVRVVITGMKSVRYIWKGLCTLAKGKIEVSVLDGVAIGVSVFRGDFKTASSVMFLLGIGEILEEWTHKKSVDDLARSMSLNVDKVWMLADDKEVLVNINRIVPGDKVVIHMGNMIPFDGVVVQGEGNVNQASLTGESLPVAKSAGGYVYAGTVLEEGELLIKVKETAGSTKFEKIVTMIEESEKLKSTVEGKASHLADKLVPYTLLGTALTYALTRNVTKALSVLMVDFSCALKLAIPITVLSAIREAGQYHITVKGGKFLEKVAEADTIVFDKTGTLTKAQPTVVDVISFSEQEPDELLRVAACLEEHFPHSMAKAVVNAAKEKGLEHEEMHSKVEYIVAHGISSMVNGQKVIVGSRHFVFDDEACVVPQGMQERLDAISEEYTQLYLAVDGVLEAVICIEDPIREEEGMVIELLREAGINKFVMMTGDNEKTASSVASKIGVDEYYAEVLPEDKAGFIEKEREAGRKVIMIGDGINDSPALSAADVGIAISDGAQIAREVADVTIGADNLGGLVVLKTLSDGLMKRIHKNYVRIVGTNSGLILLGVTGMIQPTTSALFHNASTLAISLGSMKDIIE